MMVVVGLIAIVTLWAVPGLKRAYEDFRIRQDLENFDTLVAGIRSYELIMNEYPHFTFYNRWAYDANWALPRYFTSGKQDGGGTLVNMLYSWMKVFPSKGTCYTINQRLTENSNSFSMGIDGGNGAYNSLLRSRYPTYTVVGDFLYLPEIYHTEDELQEHRNRYY